MSGCSKLANTLANVPLLPRQRWCTALRLYILLGFFLFTFFTRRLIFFGLRVTRLRGTRLRLCFFFAIVIMYTYHKYGFA